MPWMGPPDRLPWISRSRCAAPWHNATAARCSRRSPTRRRLPTRHGVHASRAASNPPWLPLYAGVAAGGQRGQAQAGAQQLQVPQVPQGEGGRRPAPALCRSPPHTAGCRLRGQPRLHSLACWVPHALTPARARPPPPSPRRPTWRAPRCCCATRAPAPTTRPAWPWPTWSCPAATGAAPSAATAARQPCDASWTPSRGARRPTSVQPPASAPPRTRRGARPRRGTSASGCGRLGGRGGGGEGGARAVAARSGWCRAARPPLADPACPRLSACPVAMNHAAWLHHSLPFSPTTGRCWRRRRRTCSGWRSGALPRHPQALGGHALHAANAACRHTTCTPARGRDAVAGLRAFVTWDIPPPPSAPPQAD
jgi:hypothetical protein